jgi:hypothetical protein
MNELELKDVASDLVHSTPIDIDTVTGSHWESGIRHDLSPFNRSVDPKDKRLKTHRLLNRKKKLPNTGWRLSYVEFEKLNRLYKFTIEGCCDPSGLNRYGTLPYYSEPNSLLDSDVSNESICCNPPWLLDVACVQHLRA